MSGREHMGGRGCKNVQLATVSPSVEQPIFSVTDDEFDMLFPGEGQDIEYNADVVQRLGPARAGALFAAMRAREVPYPDAIGIHGTLFWNCEHSRRYYPTKKSSDIILRLIDDEEWEHTTKTMP